MDNTISFKYNAVSSFEYADDGHYHLNIPTFYTLDNFANDNIDFIFDTGAYLTVITRQTALLFGFDKLAPLKTNIPLNGFTGDARVI